MRLKTLRKERPAFENEGAVINGNRMDISNNEFKPLKHRTNNTFALPTSLHTELSSVNRSPYDHTPELNINHPQQTSIRRALPSSSPSPPTHVSTYQAIEAAYLEHGIRIHLNSTTAAAVTQQQNLPTENGTGKKSTNNIYRHKAFINRNPSRPSSALHYTTSVPNTNQDSRPFSALQSTSPVDSEQINTQNISSTRPIENQNQSQLSQHINNNYCPSSILASEQSDRTILPTPLTIANSISPTATLINNDPDLAYMSSLLQTTNGDSYRDTIRRRAGLRATFAVHRHPQLSTATTVTPTLNTKLYEKLPVTHSPTVNRRNALSRTSTIAVVPTTTTTRPILSSKKIEKDILRHASRIRTSRIKDSFLRQQTSLRSQTSDYISSISNSPTRLNYPNKRNQFVKPSKSVSLEPLELILAPAPRPSPSTSARATSLSLHDSPIIHRNNRQENIKSSKKRTQSPKISFVENNNNTHDGFRTNDFLNEHSNSSFVNDDSLTLMKTSPLDMMTNNKIRQSNSFDSGCYDRSTSSGDTHSIISLSINQASSSLPSARLTSASTRRSNLNKKVSFEDQSTAIIITTATYV